jgi:lipid-A-disaccharide synthase-like uncharacterized protein
MKPGPIVAMLAILGLSMWIMLWSSHSAQPTPGAVQFDVVVSSHKAKVELIQDATTGATSYRFLDWTEVGDSPMSQAQFEATLRERGNLHGRPSLLRIFNVSTYGNLLWVGIGLGGQLVFSARLIVQWLASEKERKSVVPAVFWYLSLGGGLCLTTYFLWRHDLVGVLGQSMGLVVYVRNIRLILLHKQGVQPAPDAVPATN